MIYKLLLFAYNFLYADSEKLLFFEKKIRPILAENCYECHSASSKKVKGNLFLDSRIGVLGGGDSGPAIVSKKPEKSLLIKAIKYQNNDLRMPPDGKLSDHDIKDLQKWIADGAIDPREDKTESIGKKKLFETKDLEDARKYWAFKPIIDPSIPKVKDKTWVKDPIDSFVLAKLDSKKLTPSPPANKYTLLRRVFFDLVGLPPSPKQIDNYMSDVSQNSYSKVVDMLLNSKRFGERWGRHWLDVARYSDTTGGGRNNPFPNANRYRDYVVNSFNDDKPFNNFIIEQIAGDLLPASKDIEFNENLTGTGFLALGPHNYELQDKDLLRMEIIDEQLSSVGRAFLGLTIGCARCHDHPFDPIPTRDYYSMAGILRNTNSFVTGNVASFHERELRDSFIDKRNAYEKKKELLENELKNSISKLKKIGGKRGFENNFISIDPLLLEGIVVDDSEAKLIGNWIDSVHTKGFVGKNYLHDNNNGKGTKSITYFTNIPRESKYEIQVSYTAGTNRSNKTPITVIHADGEQKIFVDQTKPPLISGAFSSLGVFNFDSGERDILQITTEGTSKHVIADAVRLIAVQNNPETVSKSGDDFKKSSVVNLQRRISELKKLIENHKKHTPPKVKKVMSVREYENPVDWHVHIRGEVRNLGPIVPRGFLAVATWKDTTQYPKITESTSGRLELANWIASSKNPLTARVYVNRIWHHLFGRGIVSSTDNFGVMGNRPTHAKLLDSLASFFIRNNWSTKALIRKIVLSNSYKMSSTTNNNAKELDPENVLFSRQNRKRLEAEAIRDAMLYASGEISFRNSELTKNRSLFEKIDRNKLPELFTVFDYPNPGLVTGNRNTSSVPTQALYMMNNDFVIKKAALTSKRILTNRDLKVEDRVKLAFLLCLNREPSEDEKQIVSDSLGENKKIQISENALEGLVHSLFACLDFRYLN